MPLQFEGSQFNPLFQRKWEIEREQSQPVGRGFAQGLGAGVMGGIQQQQEQKKSQYEMAIDMIRERFKNSMPVRVKNPNAPLNEGNYEPLDVNEEVSFIHNIASGQGKKGFENVRLVPRKAAFSAGQLGAGQLGAGDVMKGEMDLRKEYQGLLKNYDVISRQYDAINKGYEQAIKAGKTGSKTAADQTLVVAFNKLLDPTSVVRESEYARTGEGQSALSTVKGFVERVAQGGTGLTDENRREVVVMARKLLEGAQQDYLRKREQYSGLASQYGLSPERVVGQDVSIKEKEDKYGYIEGELQRDANGVLIRYIGNGQWEDEE